MFEKAQNHFSVLENLEVQQRESDSLPVDLVDEVREKDLESPLAMDEYTEPPVPSLAVAEGSVVVEDSDIVFGNSPSAVWLTLSF